MSDLKATLRIETWSMPAADLGPDNPLPPLGDTRDVHTEPSQAPGISPMMLRNMNYGRVPNPLPYTMQDGYTRHLQPRDFRVAVLENEVLRATFLLEFGGRMWSLVHKPSGRELLAVNPVFRLANLAIRNAWFSGGVEWNIGTIGHSPFTCSPLFAARIQRDDGTPMLRMYEWERIRQVPFQIDIYLSNKAPVLLVWVRIINPHDRTLPMYWWSNIAVPETEDTRVIVPADSAYQFGYHRNGLGLVSVPEINGTDISYPTNIDRSADFFFHIPMGTRPWIAALDRQGKGLVQVSTERLLGRKLFVWGMGVGGRRWQRFLSQPGYAYSEVQAGLARTQMEHLPMPAHTAWEWLEAYGLMEADSHAVHSSDWSLARRAVEDQLERLIPRVALDAAFEQGRALADRPPDELLQRGSGWGTLERLRRAASGEPPFCSEALIFDIASLGRAQQPWIDLLNQEVARDVDPEIAPHGYMIQREWHRSLEEAAHGGRMNWLRWLHLGVMRYYIGDRLSARQAWEASLKEARTPWALRNLAFLAYEEGWLDEAADLYIAACQMCPSLLPLAVECGEVLIDMDRAHEWLDLLHAFPQSVRTVGRIRLLEGWAALAVRDFERVAHLFSRKLIVPDLREGERSLSQLWFAFHEQRLSAEESVPANAALRSRVRWQFPVPPEIDFRMSNDASDDVSTDAR